MLRWRSSKSTAPSVDPQAARMIHQMIRRLLVLLPLAVLYAIMQTRILRALASGGVRI